MATNTDSGGALATRPAPVTIPAALRRGLWMVELPVLGLLLGPIVAYAVRARFGIVLARGVTERYAFSLTFGLRFIGACSSGPCRCPAGGCGRTSGWTISRR